MPQNLRPGQSIGRVVRTEPKVPDGITYPGTSTSPGLRMSVPVRRTDRHGTDWRIWTEGGGPFITEPEGVPSDYGSMAEYTGNQEYAKGIGIGSIGYGRPRSGRKSGKR